MEKEENNSAENDKSLETLLRLPVKNLENRIQELEKEIRERQNINEQALSTIEAHKHTLEHHIHQLRYVSMFCESFIVKRDFLRQLHQLEENAIKEMTGCFWDISQLKHKLQSAREELEEEKEKLKIMND
jgi:hypothetical protein